MKARYAGGIVYFLVIAMTLLMRVSGGLGIYDRVSVNSDVFFTLIIQLLCFGALPLVGYFIIAKRCDKNEIRPLCADFNLKKCSLRNFVYSLAVTLPIMLLTGVISFAWNNVLALIGFDMPSSEPAEPTAVNLFIGDIVLTAMLPGIFEELTHRGLVFAAYRDSGYKVIPVSALLFALMHQYIPQTGYTFFFGLMLAMIVYYTGSVFPAMFIHFFNNFISVVADYAEMNAAFAFVDRAMNWLYSSWVGIGVLFVCIIASVALIFYFFDKMRSDAVANGRIPDKFFYRGGSSAIPYKRDLPFIVTVLTGAAATLFSFVWGMV